MQKNSALLIRSRREVTLVDKPSTALKPNQVRIRTRRTLVSTGTELTIYKGEFPENSAWSRYAVYPFVPGYANVGDIIEVGSGVERAWLGRRVASPGPHAKFIVVDQDKLYPFDPERVSDEEASFFALAQIVMNGVRRGKIRWGEAAAVFGLGLLGQLAVRFLRLSGARPVFSIDLSENRFSYLPGDGLVVALNPASQDPVQSIRARNHGRLADAAFEVTGSAKAIPAEIKVIREQGRLVLLSSPSGPTEFDFHDLCNRPSITIVGAHTMSTPPAETPDNPWTKGRHAEFFFDLLASGDLDVKPLISHRVHYHKATEVYDMLLSEPSSTMGVIINWEDE